MKRVLVTAGSTVVPIDQVRQIGNVFKGRTGTDIAYRFNTNRYLAKPDDVAVTLLTSNPELCKEYDDPNTAPFSSRSPFVRSFRTFDDLAVLMEQEIRSGQYDTIIHSAAVSDYKVARVLEPAVLGEERFPIDASKKISGSYGTLYLELSPTIKLVDQIREPWGFNGKLVKFKLQVGISDKELIEIARKSLAVSKADFIVANCLEWCRERAFVIGADGSCENVSRAKLPDALWERLR